MVMPGGTGTAVIPTGQCGILVVSGTVERPVVQDGAVRPGKGPAAEHDIRSSDREWSPRRGSSCAN
ncbi:MAG: hypothetical protein IPI73_01405 [Betaproteobacteria bacterium]|nr:hypothetical protein [Betaproteobacteria bacterium]